MVTGATRAPTPLLPPSKTLSHCLQDVFRLLGIKVEGGALAGITACNPSYKFNNLHPEIPLAFMITWLLQSFCSLIPGHLFLT